MNKLMKLVTAVAVTIALTVGSALAFYNLTNYWFQVYDIDGSPIESGLTVEVIDSNGETLDLYATPTSIETTKTNPVAVSAIDPKGLVSFYQRRGTSFGVKMTDDDGNILKIDSIGATVHRVIFPTQVDRYVGETARNINQEWIAPIAKATATVRQVEISTPTIVGSTVVASGITTPAVPRNLQVVALFDAGNSTTTIAAVLKVEGVNAQGVSDTESISFSTTTATGNKAWASISTFTITASTFTAGGTKTKVTYSIGTENKFGLISGVETVADVYKISENKTDVAVSSDRINTTYDTYSPAETPDGSKNYEIWYKGTGR